MTDHFLFLKHGKYAFSWTGIRTTSTVNIIVIVGTFTSIPVERCLISTDLRACQHHLKFLFCPFLDLQIDSFLIFVVGKDKYASKPLFLDICMFSIVHNPNFEAMSTLSIYSKSLELTFQLHPVKSSIFSDSVCI